MIGGDWYDAFTLPDGQLWLVIGDVSGHGLSSAVVMGRVRSSLRAYALLGGGPVRVLELTDRKVHHFDMGAMITVLCAVSSPPYETFEICSAGHPAPVLARAGGDALVVDIDTNMPLGSIPGVKRTSVTVEVNLGDTLALYTDGLVERSGVAIDRGIARLRAVAEAQHPEIVCRTVMMNMIGNSTPTDDIALLVARRTAM
jgi:serine phosphatase RsbU (regulator of sigma subunit)